MKWLIHEWRLFQRSTLSVVAILLLLALTTMSVWSGLKEVERQHQTIEQIGRAHV